MGWLVLLDIVRHIRNKLKLLPSAMPWRCLGVITATMTVDAIMVPVNAPYATRRTIN
jgi:hypothetical protein